MAVTEADIQEIEAKLEPLIGQAAWGVSLGVGSFVTLEFGALVPPHDGEGVPHGQWHLWIYCSAWRIDEGNEVLTGSEDSREKLEAAVRRMDGLVLQHVGVSPPALETSFNFDQGISLRVFPIFSEGFEHWMLYTPDGNVLTVGPGTSWTYESASRVPD